MKKNQSGLFHLDSNNQDRLTFFDIVSKLKQLYNANWIIEPSKDYVHDQRLLEACLTMPSLSERLAL